jgi:hypothetical protein
MTGVEVQGVEGIAHGNLTQSPVDGFRKELISSTGFALGVNYGLEQDPLSGSYPVDSRIRARAEVVSVDEVGGGWWQSVTRFTLKVEGNEKPCIVDNSASALLRTGPAARLVAAITAPTLERARPPSCRSASERSRGPGRATGCGRARARGEHEERNVPSGEVPERLRGGLKLCPAPPEVLRIRAGRSSSRDWDLIAIQMNQRLGRCAQVESPGGIMLESEIHAGDDQLALCLKARHRGRARHSAPPTRCRQ